jgi:sugar lactone lactonase YvrE
MAKRLVIPFVVIAVAALSTLLYPAINLTENSLLISDMGTNRIIRVRDLTAAGWEEGPSIAGLSFDHPWHISLDSVGRIYVADRNHNRIVRMEDIAGTGWKAFSGIGTNILGNYSETTPGGDYVSSVGIDSGGRIYVTGPGHLYRMDDMDGTNFSTLLTGMSTGLKNILFDSQGRMYLSDNGGHRIIRMNDFQGTGMISYGSYGDGVGQFNEPEGMTMDSQGRLYISDESNHRIIRINDMTGAGWTAFGSYGYNPGQMSLPHDVQLDNQGRIYIADTGNHRVIRINSMTGAGWIEIARRGCPTGCGSNVITGAFLLNADKGIRVLGSGPTLTYKVTFPQIAVGGGYRTSIIGVNTGSRNIDAELSVSKNDPGGCRCGVPLAVNIDGVSNSTFTRRVSAMGTVRLDAMSTEGVTAGYASILSNEELNGVALFQAMNGNSITSEAGVGLSTSTDHFTVYIDNTNDAQTGYAIVNPSRVAEEPAIAIAQFSGAQINMTLRDKNGATLETTSFNLGRGQHLAEFASQRFPSRVVPGFEGSIEFFVNSSLSILRAVALRYDNAAQDVFTTIPVVSIDPDPNEVTASDPTHRQIPRSVATTLYYPQVVDGGTYRTNFILVNPSDTATTATMSFFADDGTPLSLPIDGTPRTSLAVPLGARAVARVITDGTSSGIKAGWARVTTPPALYWKSIGGSAIFQTVDGRITSEAGVSSSPLASHFMTYVDSRGFAQSGVAVSNPNNTSVNVTFNLRDTSGTVVGSATKTLPAMGHTAQFFTQLFPQGFDEFEGTLELLTNGASISGVALRYDNPNLSVFATMPLIPIL